MTLLKDSQAVFTNLEKLYLYRYVFTKGLPSSYKVKVENYDKIEDEDITYYLEKMNEDKNSERYKDITFYEDTLLWIGREYKKRHIKYIEISDTTLVKKDASCAEMLKQIHHILPYLYNQ